MPPEILPPELAAAFPAAGRIVAAQPSGHGHINRTFVLTAEGGARFVLQQINGRVFRRIPELMENIRRVTTHLRAKSPRGLELVPARDGAVFVRDSAGEAWRLYRFIAGAHTVDQATDPAQARETARAFGAFQAQLADLPGGRLHETIPDFHHTRRRFDAFAAAVVADPCNRAAAVRAEIAFAAAREADADRLLGLLARGEIRERITHNDTKLNNVMLDDATGRGVAVVDLDTVMPGLSLYDFGDMVRTSVAAAAEDEPDPARVEVRLPFFRALVEGYLETAAGLLNATERAHLAFAGRLLAYEQGLRFLTDYLQGDTYYRIHRPAQNLDRTRAQFALVRGLQTQEVALDRIVSEIHGSPMKLSRSDADIYLPAGSAGLSPAAALARTTHLCMIAHQDDIEINAYPGVAACYGRPDKFFTGVVMTNGAGSARTGKYAAVTDEQMQGIRRQEQRTAADLGKYNLQLQLGHASRDVKSAGHAGVLADLAAIFGGCGPQLEVVYLHQPMDKHDTHVGCFLRCIEAIRALPRDRRPRRVLGVEGWRDLDWLDDTRKVPLDASAYPQLAQDLVAVFDSQIAGGKRYDLAAFGRRTANATFFASHSTDAATAYSFAVDLTPLVIDDTLSPSAFALDHVERFRADVANRLKQLGG